MSRARSVPAFIVAKSAPWMNGTASAKATIGVGREARAAASPAWSPPAFTASRSSGKTSGATTFAGWRSVRTTERRASWPTWSAKRVAHAGSSASSASLSSSLAGALERAAGLREEDVVERRLVQLQLLDLDALGVERAHDLGEVGLARRAGAPRRPATAAHGSPKRARIAAARSLSAGSAGIDLDRRAADLRLELPRACPRRRSGRGR